VGDGDHDQGDTQHEPVASSTAMRRAGRGISTLAFRSVQQGNHRVGEEFLYELKAGPSARQRRDGNRGTGLTHAIGGARAVTSAPGTVVVAAPTGDLGGSEKPPMTWIIVLLLILGTAAVVGLRIEALTWRDRPAEPSQAQRWRAMGGGAVTGGATSGPHPGHE
jgi:hypothetical protein